MIKPVKKAVFPVAGLGTRFLPATKAVPKEMLTVVDKPLIQYAVEEAAAAGIEEFIFVTGRDKNAIENYFDHSYELEAELGALQALAAEEMTVARLRETGAGKVVARLAREGSPPVRAAAAALLAIGESVAGGTLDAARHAALTMLANTILNLDETMTRE